MRSDKFHRNPAPICSFEQTRYVPNDTKVDHHRHGKRSLPPNISQGRAQEESGSHANFPPFGAASAEHDMTAMVSALTHVFRTPDMETTPPVSGYPLQVPESGFTEQSSQEQGILYGIHNI